MSKTKYFTFTGNMLGALTLIIMVTLVHFVFPSHKVEIAAIILAIVATVYPAIMLAQNVPLKDALAEGGAAAVTLSTSPFWVWYSSRRSLRPDCCFMPFGIG